MKVGIVGAGIAGLAHAYLLARAGHQVTVFERDAFATGASVRNFGMIWPIGQPPALRELALRSRDLWEGAAAEAGLFFRSSGSIHAAHHPLEMAVLEEFAATEAGVTLLSPAEMLERVPSIRAEGLEGGMFSATEACVDPREAVHGLARYLAGAGVEFRWNTPVMGFRAGEILTASGSAERFDHVIAGLGPDLPETDPGRWAASGMRRCRLQMLRFRPLREERLGVHLAFGLTLGHYANFASCPSLAGVRAYHAERWPRQKEFGIHILLSEHADGTITVGDSHDGDTLTPYRREEVDAALLEAAETYFDLDDYTLLQRWEGTYPTHAELPYYLDRTEGLTVVSLFGTGMTLSFGVAELNCQNLL